MNKLIQADVLSNLLAGRLNSLATWFAEPMSPEQAEACLPDIRRQARMGACAGACWFDLRLAELIVAFWRGHDIEADYRNLSALAAEQRQQAVLRLCYGQLLLARRCETAWHYLDDGFRLAANLLDADEYFQVLKRHDLLHGLPLSAGVTGGPTGTIAVASLRTGAMRKKSATNRHCWRAETPTHRFTSHAKDDME